MRARSAIRSGFPWLTAGLLALGLSVPAMAEAPARVVSMNLCTDQLALLLAAPGQLVSVSLFAQDPRASVMAEAARALPSNSGQAEEIHLMRPDLVLAGMWSSSATVAMLGRLGIEVVRFAPENRLEDVEANLTRMGEVLGQEARAAEVVAQFRARRAALAADLAALEELRGPPPRVLSFAQQGWVAGTQSLEGAILEAAGFANIAGELGFDWGGLMGLEAVILADPDRLLLPRGGEGMAGERRGWSEAQALLGHPALRASRAYAAGPLGTGRDWVCGLPQILDAVAGLIAAERARLETVQ